MEIIKKTMKKIEIKQSEHEGSAIINRTEFIDALKLIWDKCFIDRIDQENLLARIHFYKRILHRKEVMIPKEILKKYNEIWKNRKL